MIGNPQMDELLHILGLNHIHTVFYIFNNNIPTNNRHDTTPNNFVNEDRIHESNSGGSIGMMESIQQDANEIHIKMTMMMMIRIRIRMRFILMMIPIKFLFGYSDGM